jgi:hypothetical protein
MTWTASRVVISPTFLGRPLGGTFRPQRVHHRQTARPCLPGSGLAWWHYFRTACEGRSTTDTALGYLRLAIATVALPVDDPVCSGNTAWMDQTAIGLNPLVELIGPLHLAAMADQAVCEGWLIR